MLGETDFGVEDGGVFLVGLPCQAAADLLRCLGHLLIGKSYDSAVQC